MNLFDELTPEQLAHEQFALVTRLQVLACIREWQRGNVDARDELIDRLAVNPAALAEALTVAWAIAEQHPDDRTLVLRVLEQRTADQCRALTGMIDAA